MRFLSVADRELRAAARQAGSYRLRWVTGLAFLGLLLWLLWLFGNRRGPQAGRAILEAMSVVTFFYCLLVGTARTADCISVEHREGTLGLLFLTNLNSAEIVAGKLCSSALAGMYGLFAIFPLLAVPLLMGGVTFDQFWKAVLALVNTVLFSVAAGFLASAVCRKQFPAVAVALGVALLFGIAPLGVSELIRAAHGPREARELVAALSPLYTLNASVSPTTVLGASGYWVSLGAVAGLASLWLGFVTWRLGKLWRDRPERTLAWERLRFWKGWETRRRGSDRALRGRLLEINPYFWLASRQRVASPVFMVLVVIVVSISVTVFEPYCRIILGRSASGLESVGFAWLWTGLVIHLLVTYYAALVSSQRLAEDKQAGALELVLSTPTNERAIGRGLWLAYGRRLAFPVLVAGLAHVFVVWIGATLIAYEERDRLPPGLSVGRLLWSAWWNVPVGGKPLGWEFGFMLGIFLWIFLLLAAVWISLGWVARWLGLRMKHPGFAPITSLALLLVPPVIIFSFLCYLADELNLDQLPERQFLPLMKWVAVGLQLGHCGLLSAWAAFRLRRDFRTTVTRRFQPARPRGWWFPSRRAVLRWTVRLSLAGGVAALLVAAYYLDQDRRGRQAWAAFIQERRQRGESLALADRLPGPVPEHENFAKSAAFLHFASPGSRRQLDYPVTVYGRLSAVEADQNMGAVMGSPMRLGWTQQTNAPLAPDVGLLTGKPGATGLTNRAQAAAFVLEELAPFGPALDQVASAAGLAFFQPSTNRTASALTQDQVSALAHLERLHYLFQLRAQARLAMGQPSDAAQDLLASLRLAGLGRQSTDLRAPQRVRQMTSRSLQPLWEGLSTHSWKADSLRDFQRLLAGFNLLADHTNVVGRIALASIEAWEKRADPNWIFRPGRDFGGTTLGPVAEALQPRAWWLLRAMRIYEVADKTFQRTDAARGCVTEFLDWSELRDIPMDGRVQQVLMADLPWWGETPGGLAYTQNAVHQAVLACALELHWLAHGHYPATLDALVPEFLNRVPPDARTGRAMGYELPSHGRYALRGAGGNLIDDRRRPTSDDWVWAYPAETNAPPVGDGGSRARP